MPSENFSSAGLVVASDHLGLAGDAVGEDCAGDGEGADDLAGADDQAIGGNHKA